MAKKNRIFHPENKAKVIAAQRRSLAKITTEEIGQMSDSQLRTLIAQHQNVLDHYLKQQTESGYVANVLRSYKKNQKSIREAVRSNKTKRPALKHIATMLHNQVSLEHPSPEGKGSYSPLTVRGQRRELSNKISWLKDNLDMKRVTRNQVSDIWNAYDKFLELSGLPEKVNGISSWTYLKNAIPEWMSIPANMRDAESLAQLAFRSYANAGITAEDIMSDDTIYESAIKNYRKFHPGFKGNLTTEQVILFSDDLV